MVEGPGAEFAIEVLGSQGPEVVDGVGPEVEHVVPGEGVPLLDHHHLAAQQCQLDGGPQAARPPAHDQTLGDQEAGWGGVREEIAGWVDTYGTKKDTAIIANTS